MISVEQLNRYCGGDITKIENYQKAVSDLNIIWHCHHRREDLGYSMQDLIDLELYFGVPPEDLILLTPKEHNRRHKVGKERPDEMKRKLSETRKGKYTSTPRIYCPELKKTFDSCSDCDHYIRGEYNDKWFQSGKILKHPDNYYKKLNLHFIAIIDNPNQLSLEL